MMMVVILVMMSCVDAVKSTFSSVFSIHLRGTVRRCNLRCTFSVHRELCKHDMQASSFRRHSIHTRALCFDFETASVSILLTCRNRSMVAVCLSTNEIPYDRLPTVHSATLSALESITPYSTTVLFCHWE
jgi:hypothetical protein